MVYIRNREKAHKKIVKEKLANRCLDCLHFAIDHEGDDEAKCMVLDCDCEGWHENLGECIIGEDGRCQIVKSAKQKRNKRLD